MDVAYRYIEGWPTETRHLIHRSVGALARHNNHLKIGLTNNPERRFTEHRKNKNWDAMHVIYCSYRFQSVQAIERYLIQYIRNQCTSTYWHHNIVDGGEGRVGSGPYYVYVLTARKYRRGMMG